MKLLFKQRFFSWFDSYDIYNENGETVYTVQGKMAWGHTLVISDYMGREVATLKQQVLNFLPRFDIIINGQNMGNISQEFRFLKPAFNVNYNGWHIEGEMWEFDYWIYNDRREEVARIEKQIFNFTDTYVIDVHNSENALQALMVVLAIDAAKCGSN